MKEDNNIKTLLIKLGICDHKSIVAYFPRVRDRNDISVLKCTKSGVIFLSKSDHIDISHYSEKKNFQYWGAKDRKESVLNSLEDDQRRFEQFKFLIANKKKNW
jgi:hypothetical protein